MKLKHWKNILPGQESLKKVTALAWSPNNTRLAVVTTDKIVTLYDENGEKRDKFSTKSSDPKMNKAYIVTCMIFSPDSTRLLVGQSDNILFVYKLGLDWNDKKSICNKFTTPCAITCAAWPSQYPNDIVFGGADGKVRLGTLKTNKASILYSTDSYVCSMASSPDGQSVIVGHIDGSIYRVSLDNNNNTGNGPTCVRIIRHSCAPYALGWGTHIVAGGSDGKVCFYEDDGNLLRTFDYSNNVSFTNNNTTSDTMNNGSSSTGGGVRDLTCAAFSPSGESVVIGSYNRFFVFSLGTTTPTAGSSTFKSISSSSSSPLREWQETGMKDMENVYTITALAWKADGSRLTIGNITGSVDIFDACLRRTRYRDKFDFTYVSPSSVIVKRLATGMRIVLRSSFGYEITNIKVYQDRYIIAHTPATLLVGDLESCKLSEVPWTTLPVSTGITNKSTKASTVGTKTNPSSTRERYFFDNPSVCLVYRTGELSLIEYGRTEILGTCRTEYMNRHYVSVRINERLSAIERERLTKATNETNSTNGSNDSVLNNKKLAYLLDAQTIHVLDLVTNNTLAMISHDARMDWIELSGRGNYVLFRDKRRRLYLYDLTLQTKSTLLSYCNYAQWVPGSDVIVAQRRNQLCVWYSVRAPDKMTTLDIRGDVEDIERTVGKTEVIVDEGLTTTSYLLDEALIGFGTAMDDGDLEAACGTLETMSMNNTTNGSPPELDAMWQQLGQEAMHQGELSVAQRCAVALGDISRARFLQRTLKIAQMATERMGGDGRNFWLVKARLAQLKGDISGAESIFLEQGRIDEAMEMHQQLHRYDDAIAVAEANGRREAETLRHQYFQYLMDSGQEEKAAALKEHEGDSLGAISLYLRGGYPAKALTVAMNKPVSFPRDVLERITTALATAGMYDKAGILLERIGDSGRALDAYIRGNAYRPAVELARRSFPQRVVELERAWGDYLVSQKQTEAAINHYIEAGAHTQAIAAAMNARQYVKAAQLIQDTLHDAEAARPFWRQLAKVYAERGALEEAEKYHVKAGDHRAAVDLYLGAGKYEAAHRVARACMSEGEVVNLYVDQARRMESTGQLRSAEKLYVAVRAYDSAINMYRRSKQYDSVLRLVSNHRPDLLRETHLSVAEALRNEGSLRAAERHYVEAGQWETAVNMFKQASLWDDAVRIARANGGQQAAHRVIYAQANALGKENGTKLLTRLGLMDQAIEYACDAGDWDRALDMASKHDKEKLPFVHFKRAMKFEDMGQYAAAEQEFIAAEKPREAIEMYSHLKDWSSALRVAENYDPASISDVLEGQGREAVQLRDFAKAEGLFLDAKRPELAVEAWFDARQYPEALRVAKQYIPHKVGEITERVKRAMNGENTGTGMMLSSYNSSSSSAVSPSTERKGRGGTSSALSVSSPTMPSSLTANNTSTNDLLATARMWESSREYGRAIDSYLNVTTDNGFDMPTSTNAWITAVQLASRYDKARYTDIAEEVGHRLAENNKLEQAGDLFMDVGQIDKAADCYVQCQAWNKAKEAVKGGPQKLKDSVDNAFKAHLMKAGDPAQMVAAGAIDAACAVYASQGAYEKVFELASKASTATLAQYIYPHAEQLINSNKSGDVVKLFVRYGSAPVLTQLPLYRRIVADLFTGQLNYSSLSNNNKINREADVRDIFYRFMAGVRKQLGNGSSSNANSGTIPGYENIPEFEKLLLAVHYAYMRVRLTELGLQELASKATISLLRFINIIPADKAFYDAGTVSKAMGWRSMALVFFNRFIDLADAIEDNSPTGAGLDNSDFIGSGIMNPGDMILSRTCSIPEKLKEEAKEWVLTISMDRKVEQSLAKRPCFACGTSIFEASLSCSSCKAQFPSCIISGYPIVAAQVVSCTGCGSKASKAAWNAVVNKTKACPWCAITANPVL